MADSWWTKLNMGTSYRLQNAPEPLSVPPNTSWPGKPQPPTDVRAAESRTPSIVTLNYVVPPVCSTVPSPLPPPGPGPRPTLPKIPLLSPRSLAEEKDGDKKVEQEDTGGALEHLRKRKALFEKNKVHLRSQEVPGVDVDDVTVCEKLVQEMQDIPQSFRLPVKSVKPLGWIFKATPSSSSGSPEPLDVERPRVGGPAYSRFLENHKKKLDGMSPIRHYVEVCKACASSNPCSAQQPSSDRKATHHLQENKNTGPKKSLGGQILSATTASPGPYSSTDLIGSYNNDASRLTSGDDLRLNHPGGVDLDRERRKSKDYEKRPSSRKDSRKTSVINVAREKGNKGLLDKDHDNRDNHKTDDGSICKNYFKPTGLRNNFVGNPLMTQHSRNLNGNRQEPDSKLDGRLVAMGTNWNPANQQIQKSNGVGGGRIASFSTPAQMSHSSTAPFAPAGTGARKVGKTSTMPHISGSRPSMKDSEPRYADPFQGSSAAFQQRIAEIVSLEAETIRWERTRKVKKKAKEG